MANDTIYLKQKFRGDNEYKIFSIRVPLSLVTRLDEIALDTDWSRNALILQFIEYGLDKYDIASDDTTRDKIYFSQRTRGEDEHSVFSVRIPASFVERLDKITLATGKSRNAIIAQFIQNGLSKYEIQYIE